MMLLILNYQPLKTNKYSSLFIMKKLLLIPVLALLIPITASAQTQQDDEIRNQMDQMRQVKGQMLNRPASDVAGSPYLNDQYQTGRVIFPDNAVSQELRMNYDIFKNQVHYLENGQIFAMSFGQIAGFMLYEPNDSRNKKVFKTGEFDQKLDITKQTPLEVIYDGEQVKLYRQYNTFIYEERTYSGENITRYVNKDYIVYKDENGEFFKTKIKKKDLLKRINKNYKKQVDKHLKATKNKVKSDEDAVAFFSYYESLKLNN